MLWRAFRSLPKGFYIDLGAWSPDRDSVTRAFYERGWSGINVEPNPWIFPEFERARPRDVNLRVAVSDTPGQAIMHFLSNSGLSTLDASIADEHTFSGLVAEDREVEVKTLAEIWRTHVPDGQEVHFLKVDVEGLEAAVLRGNDWTLHRPWAVVVEATFPMSQVETYANWESILHHAGYRHVYSDGLNRYYIDPVHEELASAFKYPPNVFDDFRLAREVQGEEQRAKLEAQLDAAETRLKTAKDQLNKTEIQLEALKYQLESTLEKLNATSGLLRSERSSSVENARALDYLRDRKLWEALICRKDGRPTKALRRLLFHNNGKPRGIFRRWVLDGYGKPRRVFRYWMASDVYLALPRAVRPDKNTTLGADVLAPVWRAPIEPGIDEVGLDRLMARIRDELPAKID